MKFKLIRPVLEQLKFQVQLMLNLSSNTSTLSFRLCFTVQICENRNTSPHFSCFSTMTLTSISISPSATSSSVSVCQYLNTFEYYYRNAGSGIGVWPFMRARRTSKPFFFVTTHIAQRTNFRAIQSKFGP